ncbi:MAG: hypothetical protein U0W65_01005 [Bacteroidia bacterium]|nr:hypothetical protein [Bacteroidia bacterium]
MGKLKGKVKTTGDSGMLSYKNDAGEKIEVQYSQPYSAEIGLALNTRVSFNIVATDKGNVAVAVAPVCKATITDISYDTGSGSLTETESGIKYPFTQNFLKESGFALDQVVTYNLITTKDGTLRAVCLELA